MGNFINLKGKKFGEWTVIQLADQHNGAFLWECQCSCGQKSLVSMSNLRGKISTKCIKCGREKASEKITTHGRTKTTEYKIWSGMKTRCYNKNNQAYKNYGGRGITICDKWRKSFQAFYDYIGKRPSNKHTIDRINNDRNYEPGNVRWATRHEQANNKRPSKLNKLTGEEAKYILNEYSKEKKSALELAKKFNVCYQTIYDVINRKTWKHI